MHRLRLAGGLVGLLAIAPGPAAAGEPPACRAGARPFARVELYFGAGQGDADAWRRFRDSVLTSHFPEGYTVLAAQGLWRDPRGVSRRERSRVVIAIYRPSPAADGRIEAVRALYKKRFRQQSVLRVDAGVCAAF